jgi:hypothetical protein
MSFIYAFAAAMFVGGATHSFNFAGATFCAIAAIRYAIEESLEEDQ